MTKFRVLQRLYSREHAKTFLPGEIVDLSPELPARTEESPIQAESRKVKTDLLVEMRVIEPIEKAAGK